MRKWIKKSFHRQLLVCFAVVALLPLLFFGVSLIQTMETKINSDYEKNVTEQAQQIDTGVLEVFGNFETVVENINANRKIVDNINEEDSWSRSKIYLQFYREVSDYREYAQLISMTETESVSIPQDREMPEWNCRFTGEF